MDVAELASYLGLPVSTVYDWRVHGKGPVAYRFGKHLKFAVSAVRAWAADQREPSDRGDLMSRRRAHCNSSCLLDLTDQCSALTP